MIPENPPTAGLVAKPIATVRADDAITAPLALLAKEGVAVLVDEGRRPVGILTWCDDPTEIGALIRKLRAEGRSDAASLFKAKDRLGRDIVVTVPEDMPLAEVADQMLRAREGKGVRTGVTVVDGKGAYRGYAFATDVNERLKSSVQRQQEAVRDEADRLIRLYPNATGEIRSWIRPTAESKKSE